MNPSCAPGTQISAHWQAEASRRARRHGWCKPVLHQLMTCGPRYGYHWPIRGTPVCTYWPVQPKKTFYVL